MQTLRAGAETPKAAGELGRGHSLRGVYSECGQQGLATAGSPRPEQMLFITRPRAGGTPLSSAHLLKFFTYYDLGGGSSGCSMFYS